MSVMTLQWDGGNAESAWWPASDTSAPGLVVVHEWWGLNDSIRAVSERFHAAGFSVLAVDLYAGQVTDDASVALQLASKMSTLTSVKIIEAAAAALRKQGSPRVAVTGFCLGGAMTLAAACHCPSASAFVPFYGLPLSKYVDWSKTVGPILGHYAEHDRIVDLNRVRAAAEAVNASGGNFELHVYDAKHAFMRADDATVFNADAAALAWERTLTFLRRQPTESGLPVG